MHKVEAQRQFDQDGFVIVQSVLSYAECDGLLSKLTSRASKRNHAGIRNLMSNSAVAAIASDERLVGIVKNISGRQSIAYKATLFKKSGKANWLVAWHQDTALPIEKFSDQNGWSSASVKDGVVFAHAPSMALTQIVALRIQLDASTSRNGPLRVIPGSHQKRLTDEADVEVWTKKSSVDCLVGKGGVIAMSPLLLHASSKCISDEPRRVLHIEYAPSFDIDDGVRLAVA